MCEIKTEVRKVKISDIVHKEDVYARIDKDQSLISKYAENIESILNSNNRIKVSINNILIDGWHRWKAFERVNGADFEVDVDVFMTDNIDLIELESYAANQQHGKSNTKQDTFRNIQRLYAKGHTRDAIRHKLSISKRWINESTEKQRADEKAEMERKAVEMYLRAENTYESIADELNSSNTTIKKIVKEVRMGITAQIDQEWNLDSKHEDHNSMKPCRYNIWNLSKQDSQNGSHFGAFPQIFMENILWYYTEPLDIIFDPFAGGGTTVDACKSMFRRYYCTDIKVTPGREEDIRQHDITTGLPGGLPKANFVFIDPPYWKQAENKYTELKNDFGNMTLPDFYTHMEVLFSNVYDRLIENGHMAFVIQNTQWLNDDKHVEPHSHKLWNMAEGMGFKFVNLIHLPYSTQQYNAQQVEYAKEHDLILELNRELVIFGV